MSQRSAGPGVPRRALLRLLTAPVLAAPLLGGCGFRPVYARRSSGEAGAAAEGLAETSILLIPERPGQLLRNALQERFERSGLALARRYDLGVTFGITSEAISIQQDTSSTYIRYVGTANYRLTAQDPSRSTLTTGTARSVDGLNFFDQQLFAADLEGDVVQQRIAEAIADSIALQLAAYFNKQAAVSAH